MSAETDHRRRKPGTKPIYQPANNGAQGPTSQIPGLSNSANTAPVEKTRGRRVGIFETDSDYVKLAKQGGQRGLLWHEETNLETKPNADYKPPDWFSASDKEQYPSKSPELMTPEEDVDSPSKGAIPNAPFGSDNKSTWEREADSFTINKDKIMTADRAAEQMKKMNLTSGPEPEANKYKRTSYDKKATPVSMSKLLSFGYVEKSPKDDDDDESSVTSEPASSIAPDEEDLE
ncbi:hypothetical protein COCON_G00049030 [Conger conger]|uniref:Uncharacterized protein n=1 Tax=Conger conger TaxID=82655 RepID=A0A9Q1DVJ2_CONCO|nr:uncharacterized protein C7orf57 homolog [Conger conger]XP_061093035.1 uncharacterized protein C7orf57 homolog [Conger conger]XP_061093036.1 uncharacterized protein C7orf57 homolog [Conger conger]XP_061093037.1 uncharacterized protein C7orf57 homolog [Conger conger]XP_061093038.1 uncharacterized protein C7orf57 homolog [Conger conger]KAJ8282384.1 hypothetical protein COCON_G00049030 [Conger conger]